MQSVNKNVKNIREADTISTTSNSLSHKCNFLHQVYPHVTIAYNTAQVFYKVPQCSAIPISSQWIELTDISAAVESGGAVNCVNFIRHTGSSYIIVGGQTSDSHGILWVISLKSGRLVRTCFTTNNPITALSCYSNPCIVSEEGIVLVLGTLSCNIYLAHINPVSSPNSKRKHLLPTTFLDDISCTTLGSSTHPCFQVGSEQTVRGVWYYMLPGMKKTGKYPNARVTSVELLDSMGSIVVGYDIGGWQIWSIAGSKAQLQFTSTIHSNVHPVTNFCVLSPENDPHNVLYLWVTHSAVKGLTTKEGCPTTATMYQLRFRNKVVGSKPGVNDQYRRIENLIQSFHFVFSEPLFFGKESGAFLNLIDFEAIQKINYMQGCNDFNGIVVSFESTKYIVTVLFDLNAWYFAQMPAYPNQVARLSPYIAYLPMEKTQIPPYCCLQSVKVKSQSLFRGKQSSSEACNVFPCSLNTIIQYFIGNSKVNAFYFPTNELSTESCSTVEGLIEFALKGVFTKHNTLIQSKKGKQKISDFLKLFLPELKNALNDAMSPMLNGIPVGSTEVKKLRDLLTVTCHCICLGNKLKAVISDTDGRIQLYQHTLQYVKTVLALTDIGILPKYCDSLQDFGSKSLPLPNTAIGQLLNHIPGLDNIWDDGVYPPKSVRSLLNVFYTKPLDEILQLFVVSYSILNLRNDTVDLKRLNILSAEDSDAIRSLFHFDQREYTEFIKNLPTKSKVFEYCDINVLCNILLQQKKKSVAKQMLLILDNSMTNQYSSQTMSILADTLSSEFKIDLISNGLANHVAFASLLDEQLNHKQFVSILKSLDGQERFDCLFYLILKKNKLADLMSAYGEAQQFNKSSSKFLEFIFLYSIKHFSDIELKACLSSNQSVPKDSYKFNKSEPLSSQQCKNDISVLSKFCNRTDLGDFKLGSSPRIKDQKRNSNIILTPQRCTDVHDDLLQQLRTPHPTPARERVMKDLEAPRSILRSSKTERKNRKRIRFGDASDDPVSLSQPTRLSFGGINFNESSELISSPSKKLVFDEDITCHEGVALADISPPKPVIESVVRYDDTADQQIPLPCDHANESSMISFNIEPINDENISDVDIVDDSEFRFSPIRSDAESKNPDLEEMFGNALETTGSSESIDESFVSAASDQILDDSTDNGTVGDTSWSADPLQPVEIGDTSIENANEGVSSFDIDEDEENSQEKLEESKISINTSNESAEISGEGSGVLSDELTPVYEVDKLGLAVEGQTDLKSKHDKQDTIGEISHTTSFPQSPETSQDVINIDSSREGIFDQSREDDEPSEVPMLGDHEILRVRNKAEKSCLIESPESPTDAYESESDIHELEEASDQSDSSIQIIRGESIESEDESQPASECDSVELIPEPDAEQSLPVQQTSISFDYEHSEHSNGSIQVIGLENDEVQDDVGSEHGSEDEGSSSQSDPADDGDGTREGILRENVHSPMEAERVSPRMSEDYGDDSVSSENDYSVGEDSAPENFEREYVEENVCEDYGQDYVEELQEQEKEVEEMIGSISDNEESIGCEGLAHSPEMGQANEEESDGIEMVGEPISLKDSQVRKPASDNHSDNESSEGPFPVSPSTATITTFETADSRALEEDESFVSAASGDKPVGEILEDVSVDSDDDDMEMFTFESPLEVAQGNQAGMIAELEKISFEFSRPLEAAPSRITRSHARKSKALGSEDSVIPLKQSDQQKSGGFFSSIIPASVFNMTPFSPDITLGSGTPFSPADVSTDQESTNPPLLKDLIRGIYGNPEVPQYELKKAGDGCFKLESTRPQELDISGDTASLSGSEFQSFTEDGVGDAVESNSVVPEDEISHETESLCSANAEDEMLEADPTNRDPETLTFLPPSSLQCLETVECSEESQESMVTLDDSKESAEDPESAAPLTANSLSVLSPPLPDFPINSEDLQVDQQEHPVVEKYEELVPTDASNDPEDPQIESGVLDTIQIYPPSRDDQAQNELSDVEAGIDRDEGEIEEESHSIISPDVIDDPPEGKLPDVASSDTMIGTESCPAQSSEETIADTSKPSDTPVIPKPCDETIDANVDIPPEEPRHRRNLRPRNTSKDSSTDSAFLGTLDLQPPPKILRPRRGPMSSYSQRSTDIDVIDANTRQEGDSGSQKKVAEVEEQATSSKLSQEVTKSTQKKRPYKILRPPRTLRSQRRLDKEPDEPAEEIETPVRDVKKIPSRADEIRDELAIVDTNEPSPVRTRSKAAKTSKEGNNQSETGGEKIVDIPAKPNARAKTASREPLPSSDDAASPDAESVTQTRRQPEGNKGKQRPRKQTNSESNTEDKPASKVRKSDVYAQKERETTPVEEKMSKPNLPSGKPPLPPKSAISVTRSTRRTRQQQVSGSSVVSNDDVIPADETPLRRATRARKTVSESSEDLPQETPVRRRGRPRKVSSLDSVPVEELLPAKKAKKGTPARTNNAPELTERRVTRSKTSGK